jgi:trehalose 6-phosphate phosphatase
LLDRGSEERARHRGEADQRCVPPVHLAENAEHDHPEERREADRGERGRGGLRGRKTGEEDQRRNDHGASTNSEQRAEEASRDADADVDSLRPKQPGHDRILPAMAADLLAPLREAPEQSALVFDVDGTVAPIAARPELAAVPEETRRELERLAGRYRLLAFVTGRPGAEAAALVGLPGARYVGNHGLELDPDAAALASKIAAFRDSVGLVVEDKGLTLSYHFREAEDEAEARTALAEVAERAGAEGLVARWGRKVLEIRPDVATDKGTAVEQIAHESGVSRLLYAGDDATDIDAFERLEAVELDHVVRVAVVSDEAPAELTFAADLVVTGPEGFLMLLARL